MHTQFTNPPAQIQISGSDRCQLRFDNFQKIIELTYRYTMNENLEKILTDSFTITDGAWGTQFREFGIGPGECPDGWNLSSPRIVEKIARTYIEAGSKIILTNTFRANRISLGSYGLGEKVREINQAGVKIALNAVRKRALVFGSVGPTGKMFTSRYISDTELFDVYSEQAQLLVDAGVDAVMLESMIDLAEAKIALKAIKETGIPAGVSMVFDAGREKDLTMMGNTPEQAAAELTTAGADIIGANCGLGIEGYIPILKRLRSSTNKPIWIKPSAGVPGIVQGNVVYSTSPQVFAQYAKVLVTHGANFIGGCCGTSPEYINLVCKLLKTK